MAITAKNGEIRRYRRFAGWDYANGASLFVTIAAEPRQPLFGKVDDGAMELSPLGEVVDAALRAMPRLNPGFTLHGHVVMPDHVHFNCCIEPGLEEPLKLFGNAIRRFKNYTTKQAKLSFAINAPSPDCQAALGPPPSPDGQAALGQFHLWQQGCHDYLLVSRSMIDSTERYIAYNPLKWALMHGAGALRIREPLFSPRTPPLTMC